MGAQKDSAVLWRLEIVETGRRRRWSEAEKQRIVEESDAGRRLVSVSDSAAARYQPDAADVVAACASQGPGQRGGSRDVHTAGHGAGAPPRRRHHRDPLLAKGKTEAARLWIYVRDDRPFSGRSPPAAIYGFSRDRRGKHPQTYLAGWRGILQADAYAGLDALFGTARRPGPVIPDFCWRSESCKDKSESS